MENTNKKSLWLSYNETRTGGEPEDPTDRWTFHKPTYINVDFESVSRTEPETFFDKTSFEVSDEVFNAENVFLVVYRYRDGSTFGTTHGYWNTELITNNREEAEKCVESLRNEATDSKREKDYNRPWNGYFSGFEGAEIYSFKVEDC